MGVFVEEEEEEEKGEEEKEKCGEEKLGVLVEATHCNTLQFNSN